MELAAGPGPAGARRGLPGALHAQGHAAQGPGGDRPLHRQVAVARGARASGLSPTSAATALVGDFDVPLGLYLQPAPPREIIGRMLRNLKEIHRAQEDWQRADRRCRTGWWRCCPRPGASTATAAWRTPRRATPPRRCATWKPTWPRRGRARPSTPSPSAWRRLRRALDTDGPPTSARCTNSTACSRCCRWRMRPAPRAISATCWASTLDFIAGEPPSYARVEEGRRPGYGDAVYLRLRQVGRRETRPWRGEIVIHVGHDVDGLYAAYVKRGVSVSSRRPRSPGACASSRSASPMGMCCASADTSSSPSGCRALRVASPTLPGATPAARPSRFRGGTVARPQVVAHCVSLLPPLPGYHLRPGEASSAVFHELARLRRPLTCAALLRARGRACEAELAPGSA